MLNSGGVYVIVITNEIWRIAAKRDYSVTLELIYHLTASTMQLLFLPFIVSCELTELSDIVMLRVGYKRTR